MNNQSSQRLGIILVVSGPSGVGKTTLCTAIRNEFKDLYFSVSCTTRAPRPHEQDGKDYYFITREQFEAKIRQGAFLEYASVFGNYYGTLRQEVMDKSKNGQDVLLDIDFQGALQVKKCAEDDSLLRRCLEFVFVAPPSYEELEKRLRGRATESEKDLRKRLDTSRVEMEYWREYDFVLINRNIPEAVDEFRDLIKVLHKSTKRMEGKQING